MEVMSAFHTAAFSASIAQNVVADVAAVPDGILTVQNSHFVMPRNAELLYAVGIGATMLEARWNTPSMRYVSLPYLGPINVGATVPSPPNVIDYTNEGIIFPPVDEVAIEAQQTSAGAEVEKVIFAVGFPKKAAPAGKAFRIKGTATITATTTGWTNGAISLVQALPQGMYAVVGMDIFGTNLFAGRLSFPGCPFRPGVLARNATGSIMHPLFTNGQLGLFGTFMNVNLPTLDVIALGANTAQTIFLDVVRISDYSPITN